MMSDASELEMRCNHTRRNGWRKNRVIHWQEMFSLSGHMTSMFSVTFTNSFTALLSLQHADNTFSTSQISAIDGCFEHLQIAPRSIATGIQLW